MSDDTSQPTPVMSGKEHFLAATALLAQLPETTSETLEEHTSNIELINVATVHAHLAMVDLLDDIAKAVTKLTGTVAASSKRVEDRLGKVEKHLKVVK